MSKHTAETAKSTAWHQGATKRAAKRLREGARRNKEAYEGKRALVATYEQMGEPAPTDLKHRMRLKQWQLKNRGMMVDT